VIFRLQIQQLRRWSDQHHSYCTCSVAIHPVWSVSWDCTWRCYSQCPLYSRLHVWPTFPIRHCTISVDQQLDEFLRNWSLHRR